MRLYLSAKSQKGATYTPDTLIVGTKEYDIQGWTDFENGGLYSRTKGDLLIRDEELDDYRELTNEEWDELFNSLDNGEEVVVAIYPISKDEDKADGDILTECDGLLSRGEQEVAFKFHTEFYGI